MTELFKDIQELQNKRTARKLKLLERRNERKKLLASLMGDASDSNAGAVDSSLEINVTQDTTSAAHAELNALLQKLSTSLNLKEINKENILKTLTEFEFHRWLTLRRSDEQDSEIFIDNIENSKFRAIFEAFSTSNGEEGRQANDESFQIEEVKPKKKRRSSSNRNDALQTLLSAQSIRERENQRTTSEIVELLSKATAKAHVSHNPSYHQGALFSDIRLLFDISIHVQKNPNEQILCERFKIDEGIQEFCEHGTKEECMINNKSKQSCSRIHFRRIIKPHTDVTLGDCSFLNTCFHMDTCKYIHYQIDKSDVQVDDKSKDTPVVARICKNYIPPQWVQCDLRAFDITVLGKFSIIMADPPWDIHMELPYGTMADDEMRRLNIPCLQDDGYIFLWVTGRAMELGRECLKIWGYQRCDELVWVKTNQLQRIIRTGRTGHWLNHGKEHCLVGVKGNTFQKFNRGLDCDVIVAEVRATSRKPDEIYGICERISPGTRKVELFGRPHNVQPNWITLGNQLDGVRLVEPDVVRRFRKRYPNGNQPLTVDHEHFN